MNATKRAAVGLSGLLLPALSLDCVQQAAVEGNQDRYQQVPIGLGIAAAGAVVSRATGGCYAVCAYGTVCDAASGACVPFPEGAYASPEGPAPGIQYGLVDPGAPGAVKGAPIHEIPRAAVPPEEAAPGIERAAPVCVRGCPSGEYCSIEKDRRGTCVPQGPLPEPG